MEEKERPLMTPQMLEKLKLTFALGMGANVPAITGVVFCWVILSKLGWADHHGVSPVVTAFCLAPLFLADAVDHYVLNRVRIDVAKGWEDIQVSEAGKKSLCTYYGVWRSLSFVSAASLAAVLLGTLSPDPASFRYLTWVFSACFLLLMARWQYVVWAFITPVVPSFAGAAFRRRLVLLSAAGLALIIWLLSRPEAVISRLGMVACGTLYLALCGILHPLPSKYSIFQPGRASRPRILTAIEPIDPDSPALSPTIDLEARPWIAEQGFHLVGALQMPLLELPLFVAQGKAYLDAERQELLLVLQSEVRGRVHRSLLSWNTDGTLDFTTDFGAPDARFPDHTRYRTLPHETAVGAFLTAHRSSRGSTDPARLVTLPEPPWENVQHEVELMFRFLHREIKPADGSPASPPSAAPASGNAPLAPPAPDVEDPQ
jgi:hypothetical protein